MVRKVFARDFDDIATFIKQEFERRKNNTVRAELEKQWDEVDRQVRMEPLPNIALDQETPDSGITAWMDPFEFPSQANSQEVISADVKRLVFSASDEWWEPHAVFTDEYAKRNAGNVLITGVDDALRLGAVPNAADIDQDTANRILKATLTHFHRRGHFREQWNKGVIIPGLKYGTFCPRVGLMKAPVMVNEFRGVVAKEDLIPMLIPTSIRNIYLDDSPEQVLHEGMMLLPSFIRHWWQNITSLERAAKFSGRGWLGPAISALEPRKPEADRGKGLTGEHKDQVECLEYEGDLVVRRTKGDDIFLTNHIVTVALGQDPRVIRMRESKLPFRSYLPGAYEPGEGVYGSSPLLRGRTLQHALTELFQRFVATACIKAAPPVAHPSTDDEIEAHGFAIEPNARWKVRNPDAIRVMNEIGDLAGTIQGLQALVSMYEETTHVNDPRRGEQGKSHTTAFAKDVEVSRSLLPTEDFATSLTEGALLSWLYMHHQMAKKAVKNGTTVFVNQRGLKGHIDVTKNHIPDDADFTVEGARGVLTEREREERVLTFVKLVTDIKQLQAQGVPISDELLIRAAEELKIPDAQELIAGGEAGAQGAPAGPVPNPGQAAPGPGGP